MSSVFRYGFLLMLIFYQIGNCTAQQRGTPKVNADSLFFVARDLAFSEDFERARSICQIVLQEYPDYLDFKVLVARTYAWESNYDTAKHLLSEVLTTDTANREALLALTDISLWQKNVLPASQYIDIGLSLNPSDSAFLERQVRLRHLTDQLNSDTLAFKSTAMPERIYKNEAGVTYYFDFFKKPYIARRHIVSLNYLRHTSTGTVIGRLNTGDNVLDGEQFMKDPSYQAEIDYYPVLSENSYLYLNYGVSSGNFFPWHRAGAEYFKGLGNGITVSGGVRYMRWENDILFLTASVSKSWSDYWLSFRPFFAVTGKNFANAYLMEGRRYFNSYRSHVFLLVMYGDSPDQPVALAEDFGNFKSARISAGIKYRVNRWLLNYALGYQYEEYLNNAFRSRFDMRIGFQYGF